MLEFISWNWYLNLRTHQLVNVNIFCFLWLKFRLSHGKFLLNIEVFIEYRSLNYLFNLSYSHLGPVAFFAVPFRGTKLELLSDLSHFQWWDLPTCQTASFYQTYLHHTYLSHFRRRQWRRTTSPTGNRSGHRRRPSRRSARLTRSWVNLTPAFDTSSSRTIRMQRRALPVRPLVLNFPVAHIVF